MDKLLQHLSKGPTTIMIGGKSPSAQELGNQLTSVGFIFINLTETKEEVSLGVFVNQAATRLDEANFISGTGHVHFEGTSSVNYIPVQCIVEISLETLTGQALIYPVFIFSFTSASAFSLARDSSKCFTSEYWLLSPSSSCINSSCSCRI